MRIFSEFVKFLFPTISYGIVALLMGTVGLGLCTIPLFNIVGYEAAATTGVLSGFIAIFLSLRAYATDKLSYPFDRAHEHRPIYDYGIYLVRHLFVATIPLILLSLNALRIRNCDYWEGVLFWVLIPYLSVIIGQTIAWLSIIMAPTKVLWRWFIAILIPLWSALSLGMHLLWEPPIIGHDIFLGYLSGSIYDEALSIPRSLIWYRMINLTIVGWVLAGLYAGYRWFQRTLALSALIVAILCFAASVILIIHRQDLGIGIERAYIADALEGVVETDNFIIHYPAQQWYEAMLPLIIEDHEFRYAQLQQFFNESPAKSGAKIRSFIYPDRETKGRLMGARNTLVAKLWLHEMHILWRGYGDSMLTHELAHIFTEPFGAGPLRLSTQFGLGVNMGLVEGIATAADWPVHDLDPDEASAAMHRLNIAPDIERLVSAQGFWTQASGRAYTLMGSFVRYLIDEYGIEKFKMAYPYGDFEGAYNVSVATLVHQWKQYLATLNLSDEQLELARYYYERSSIFGKVCARSIAEDQRQATMALEEGNLNRARRLYEHIIALDPQNSSNYFAYINILSRMSNFQEMTHAIERAQSLSLNHVQTAQLLAHQGDIAWHLQQYDDAAEKYSSCLEFSLPQSFERTFYIKHSLVKRADQSKEHGYRYLLDNDFASLGFYYLTRWHYEMPDDLIANYLLGRRLWDANQCPQAISYLKRVVGQISVDSLDAEVHRMIGQCYYFADQLDDAQTHFMRLSQYSESRFARDASQWIERISWKRTWNRQ